MRGSKNFTRVIAAVAVIAVLVAVVLVVVNRGGKNYVVADFPKAIALYKGSDVKILGVKVGSVDSVTPMGTKVEVKFSYDSKYKVPAGAKAVVISPSIVGDRFVQLTPAYTGGPTLADNAHLGLSRTATPLELDQIFGSLNDLSVALGPHGANAPDSTGTGALTRLLDATARNFGGQGVEFNQTVKNLGKLTKTLSDNKNELFGSAAQVEKFVNALSKNDQTVRQFADALASGSALLAGDRQDLGKAVDNLSVALTQVRSFVADNRAALSSNISGLTRLSNTLVKRRSQLDETLRVAPLALNNLGLTYDSNAGTLDTRDDLSELVNQLQSNPAHALCALLNLDGLLKNPGLCNAVGGKSKAGAKGGRSRPAALTGGTDYRVDTFDPTLGGLVGVAK